MSDSALSEAVVPDCPTPFVTLEEAEQLLNRLADLAPQGGTAFGITVNHFSRSTISGNPGENPNEWRIGVKITVPYFANMVFGKLANWGVPWSTRTIAFVVKARANAATVETRDGKKLHKVHSYALLNGTFQQGRLSTEMERAKPFSDHKLRLFYGSTFDCNSFQNILAAVRSEVTGEPFVYVAD